MSRRRREGRTWPFLLVLTSLFVLSVIAPRGWERIAQRHGPIAPKKTGRTTSAGSVPSAGRSVEVATVRERPGVRVARQVSPRVAAHARGPIKPDWTIPTKLPAPVMSAVERVRSGRAPWVVPEVLIEQLDNLACECGPSAWALRVNGLIAELTSLSDEEGLRADEILAELDGLADENCPLLADADKSHCASETRRALHALSRRLRLWQVVSTIENAGGGQRLVLTQSPRLADCVAEVTALTESGPQGESWRDYLLLDTLAQLAEQRTMAQRDEQQALARQVLARLESPELSRPQRQFVSVGPMAELAGQLRQWAAEPVDPRELLERLEEFEQSALPSEAGNLMAEASRVGWLPSAGEQIGPWVQQYYRNANLRFAFTPALIRRFLPDQPALESPVRDTILGVPTRGWSNTTTQLDVRPVVDPYRLLFELGASGQITASTRSTSGPATFFTLSNGDYSASKLFELTWEGLRGWPADARADNDPRLRDVETDFDWLPLVGPLVQSIARARHAENQAAARRISTSRITSRIRAQLDSSVQPRIAQANQRFEDHVRAPVADMQLDPRLIQLSTSERGWTVRLRLAAEDQLAAHTPRPRAPSDSLVSVQMHQSLVNNIAEQFAFDGATFTLPQLQARLAEVLGVAAETFSETEQEDIRLTFAPRDSLRARFLSDRVELYLSFARLEHGRRAWRNFTVRIDYRPESDGLSARFVRDGTVHLLCERAGPQIALRGMFTRVFSRDRVLEVLHPRLAGDARLDGLEVTQFVVADGWLGLALGPRRLAAAEMTRAQ